MQHFLTYMSADAVCLAVKSYFCCEIKALGNFSSVLYTLLFCFEPLSESWRYKNVQLLWLLLLIIVPAKFLSDFCWKTPAPTPNTKEWLILSPLVVPTWLSMLLPQDLIIISSGHSILLLFSLLVSKSAILLVITKNRDLHLSGFDFFLCTQSHFKLLVNKMAAE